MTLCVDVCVEDSDTSRECASGGGVQETSTLARVDSTATEASEVSSFETLVASKKSSRRK